MSAQTFSIRVPATTANLGPGFDSVGIALSEYMTVYVSAQDGWKVSYKEDTFQELARDETNLIVKTAIDIANRYEQQLPPQSLYITSTIPFGKGFGSSASAIATGIVLADTLLDLQLSDEEKVWLGYEYEGHIDNVSAALLGGVVINYVGEQKVQYIHLQEADVQFIALVPPEILTTTASRGLLPEMIAHEEAVQSSTANGVLTAALVQNNWPLVGEMMEKDCLHERYRKALLPFFNEVRNECQRLGAYGMTVSGAGPSLLIAVNKDSAERIAAVLSEQYPYYKSIVMSLAIEGAIIKKEAISW